MPWKKGESGNPAGRPKGRFRKPVLPANKEVRAEIQSYAAQYAVRAIDALVEIGFSRRAARDRIAALRELLAWGYAKPSDGRLLQLAGAAPHSIEVRFLPSEPQPDKSGAAESDIGKRIDMERTAGGGWRLISRDKPG